MPPVSRVDDDSRPVAGSLCRALCDRPAWIDTRCGAIRGRLLRDARTLAHVRTLTADWRFVYLFPRAVQIVIE